MQKCLQGHHAWIPSHSIPFKQRWARPWACATPSKGMKITFTAAGSLQIIQIFRRVAGELQELH